MAFTQKTILNVIMIILLVLIRGSLQFILVYTQHGFPPITLVSFRSLLAVVVLGAIMGTRSYISPQFWADWKASWSKRTFVLFIVMGVLNNDASIMLFAYGSPLIGASLSSILLSTTGLFVIIFSPMFLKQGQDPITRYKIIGTIVGFLGVVTIVLPKMFLSDSHHIFRLDGFCLVLGGVFAQALSQVIWKRWSILIPQNTTLGARDFMGPFSQSLFGGVLGMGLAMFTDYLNPPYDLPKHFGFFLNIFEWRNVLAILWLGIVSGVVAMLCLFYLIGSIGTAKTALCNYAFPIVGILEGALILHEFDGQSPLSLGIQGGGFLIVIGGLVISNMKGKQKRVTKLRPMPSKTGERQPLLRNEQHDSVADPEIFASLAQEKM